jgi:hypothetical protein
MSLVGLLVRRCNAHREGKVVEQNRATEYMAKGYV